MKAFVGFAGFGGVEIAMREFDYHPIGVEIDEDTAAVNRLNGGDIITADLLAIDPAHYTDYDLFHFSPPCPNFSVAKAGGSEQESDLDLAHKICEFIRVGRPKFFTLENVWAYRKSSSWLLILDTLQEQGYGVGAWNLNAADYGVPQTRRRMICIACRDGKAPTKPWPTHRKNPDMFTKPWCGWYEAIEDLIPNLPESQFAPWQLKILPEELKRLLATAHRQNFLDSTEPSPAITASHGSQKYRALIMNGENSNANNGNGIVRHDDKPVFTITSSGISKALLIPGDNTGNGVIRAANEPMVTLQTRPPERCPHRAMLINSTNTTRQLTTRELTDPSMTIEASVGRRPTSLPKAIFPGRVVSMTPRALARFQDFPDWFTLPDNRVLACKGIGNALPPGLYRAVLRSLA